MFLSASVENTPKLSNLFLFSVNVEGHPLCLQSCISAFNYPPECPVTHEKQLAALQDQSHSLVTGAVHCHKFWLPCCFTPPFTCGRTSHIDWQEKEWEKGNIVPVSLGGNYCPDNFINASEVVWGACRELWTAVECENITPLLSAQLGQSGCGCDRGSCAPALWSAQEQRSFSRPSRSVQRHKLHLLVTHSGAIFSTEDLQFTDSCSFKIIQ